MLLTSKENGQGLYEYALIIVFVALLVVIVLSLLGTSIGDMFSNTMNVL
jgi:pilus assembly protein Flp/PilA